MKSTELILVVIGVLGFLVAFAVQFRLRHHVSIERVRELLDTPAELYRNLIPPRRVLDESGRRLFNIMAAGLIVFCISISVLIVLKSME